MDSINLVIESLCISNPGAAVWIVGDFNLPDIDWPTDQIIGHQYPLRLNDSFLQVLARTGLEQIVHFPTRLDNTLDLVLTNRPSLVNRCEGLPGIGDHDVVFADFNTQARRQKPVRHMIHLWKRADFNLIRSETKVWADNFVANHSSSTPVEVLSSEIEHYLEKTLKHHVPSKMTSSRFNQPWYSTATKRICRRKARAFKKARRTNRDRDWKRYRCLKKQTQLTCRQAYNQYLTNIICSEPGGGKRLGALIKAKTRTDRYCPSKGRQPIYCIAIRKPKQTY